MEAKPLTLHQICWQTTVSKFNSLSNAVFGLAVAILPSSRGNGQRDNSLKTPTYLTMNI